MEFPITVPGQPSVSDNKIQLLPHVFNCDYNEGLVHQLLVAYQAKGRAGTKANKSRSAVSGGGKKPWRQKGTGRARAGSSRSPLWRKGGVTFAAVPRDYTQKLNKKIYRAGMRSILSSIVRESRLTIVENFTLGESKTRQALTQFSLLNLSTALVVMDEVSDNVRLAVRNLKYFDVIPATRLNPVCLIGSQNILMTVAAVKKIESWLG